MITKSTEKTEKTEGSVAVCKTSRCRGCEVLEYYLYLGEEDGRDSYSIQIIQYKRGRKVCQSTSADITSDRDEAMRIFRLVSDGFVEPYILSDVIYDLLP